MVILRKTKFLSKVRSDSDDYDPLSFLRNPAVRGVATLIDYVVMQTAVLSARVDFLKPTQVVDPILIGPPSDVGKTELMDDVAVVSLQSFASEPSSRF